MLHTTPLPHCSRLRSESHCSKNHPRCGARALRPSSPNSLEPRLTYVTVLLRRIASARACRVGTRQRQTHAAALSDTELPRSTLSQLQPLRPGKRRSALPEPSPSHHKYFDVPGWGLSESCWGATGRPGPGNNCRARRQVARHRYGEGRSWSKCAKTCKELEDA